MERSGCVEAGLRQSHGWRETSGDGESLAVRSQAERRNSGGELNSTVTRIQVVAQSQRARRISKRITDNTINRHSSFPSSEHTRGRNKQAPFVWLQPLIQTTATRDQSTHRLPLTSNSLNYNHHGTRIAPSSKARAVCAHVKVGQGCCSR